MSATTEHPKIFISYSWTNTEHEQFVLELSTALRSHGVDAILDKWDLKPGQDKFVFMESMVVDPEVVRVLVICDRVYQNKANARKGGVGTESQIISQELYGKVTQTKFIPVVCEYDDEGNPCLPVFMKGLIFIDVSTEEKYGEGLDQLLRLIYGQPFHQKPGLGSPPAFVASSGASYVKELSAALRAIQDGKANRQGLEAQYIKGLLGELDKQYVTPEGQDYDEGVYHAIVATKGLRDQLSDYADAVAAFSGDDPSSLTPFIKLMEGIGSHFGPPVTNGRFYPGWTDIYAYFALESLLIQTAALIRHSRWKSLRRLVSAAYVVHSSQGVLKAATYHVFNAALVALDEHRNHRLKLNRACLSADLLKERSSMDKTSFSEIMEADVFLTLASVVQAGAATSDNWPTFWAPKTGVYHNYASKSPLFIRVADEDTRNGIHTAIGVSNGADLKARLESVGQKINGFGRLSRGHFNDFNFLDSINVDDLTR